MNNNNNNNNNSNNNIKIFEMLNQKINILQFENEKLLKRMNAVRKTNIQYIGEMNKANSEIKRLKESAKASIEVEQLQLRLQISEHQKKKLNQTMDRVRTTNFNYIRQITQKNQRIRQLINQIDSKDMDIIVLQNELNKCICKKHKQIVSGLTNELKEAQLQIETLKKKLHLINEEKNEEPVNCEDNEKLDAVAIAKDCKIDEQKSQSESVPI